MQLQNLWISALKTIKHHVIILQLMIYESIYAQLAENGQDISGQRVTRFVAYLRELRPFPCIIEIWRNAALNNHAVSFL